MGVPKFYRWLSERYPCLSEVVKEYQIPEFDNLYLDMNGIIHNCSHPNDDDVHFRISEEKIFADIFHYLEVLFRMIRPRKVFFMAIDGVAPRAKMNQQRGRRFRSAKEAEEKEKEALAKGEVLPTEQRFDSNCITPGTEFMAKLQEQLKYFVSKKISTDPLWQRVRVILSGHQVPGEGEHKIMEFIRYQRSQPDYDVDTRHCLYGLDADLIMLGLCTHEPYFSLLREEVKFGGKKNEKRTTTPESICFHLLHLSLMREYLELEFQPLKSKLPFEFDIERVIDDWVLMGFLVGNDFIPHLPHFHINKGALPLLYEAYMDVLPTLSGYLNENGYLNLERFEKFMNRLSQIDYDHFNDIYADVKWLEERHGRKQLVPSAINSQPKSKNPFKLPPSVRSTETLKFLAEKAAEIDDLLADGEETSSDDNAATSKMDSEVDESDRDPEDESSYDEDDLDEEEDEEEEDEDEITTSDEDKQFHAEFKAHKRNYYMEKLEFSEVDGSVLRDQAEGYVRAIQWILHYYYNGVCSWSWFYPHHYAPYVSDIRNFANLDLSFDLGHPFLPYEQLLGVLPAASKALLPEAFRSLMVSANSPIIEFYPANFQTDKNGKQQEWEAVVLIPFIDEKRLIAAMKDCETRMMEHERLRNSHGPMQIYAYTEQDLGQLEAPAHFSTIVHNHAQCQEMSRDAFVVPESKLVKRRHPKSTLERYIPGFPSTRHLQFTGALKKANVCVFHMGSLNESMILTLTVSSSSDVQEVARQYCGQTIFVNWPHLVEAKVVSVSNKESKYSVGIDSLSNPVARTDLQMHSMGPRDIDEWRSTEKEIRNRYANRWGIEIGETQIIVHACPIIGRKYAYTQSGRVTLEKQWAPVPAPFVLQATLKDISAKDIHDNQFLTLAEVFPINSVCFMLGHPGYGLQGRVLSTDKNSRGKVRIEFDNIHEPDNENLRQRWMAASSTYFPGYVAAQRLGISPHLLSRITGTVFLNLTPDEVDADASRAPKSRKINVGLNLKFNKRNEEVPGWSRKVDAGWQYSIKTVTTLKNYMREFPEFFDYIDRHSNCDVYTDTDVFGEEHGIERGRQLNEFVQKLESHQADRQSWGASAVESVALAGLLKYTVAPTMKLKPFVMQVRPHLLYKPDLSSGSSSPDPSANYHLLDRVVNVRIGYSVPLGLRGTVIGIKNAQKMMDTVFEVLFDEEFPGALPIRGCPEAPPRVYHVPAWSLINLSHGNRQKVERERQGKPTAVVRPSASASNKKPQQDQASKYQPNKSYKDAVEQPTRTRLQIKFSNESVATSGGAKQEQQPKMPVQPKLLTRPKGEATATKIAQSKTTTTETTAVPAAKTAPNPSSLPNPFMDIWNSLLQQHQAATAAQAKASDTSSVAAVNEDQQANGKEKAIPQAPKFPSLQEAARNLPKITKPAAPGAPALLVPPAADNLNSTTSANQSKPPVQQPVPPTSVQAAPIPSGPSLSIEQLFQMAGQAPVRPVPPPMPAVFSACAQLMDISQRRGLGIPLYNYIGLQDGSVVAEIVLPHIGLLSRCVGKDRPEASELAAAMALRHPIMMQPIQPLPAMFPHPFHGMPLIQPSAAVSPFNITRPPVPNSFVPLQVVRQSVHHQQKMHHQPPASSVPQPTTHHPDPLPTNAAIFTPPPSDVPANVTSTAATDTDKAESKIDACAEVVSNVLASTEIEKQISPAGRTPTSKPPGSRLAIRFTKP